MYSTDQDFTCSSTTVQTLSFFFVKRNLIWIHEFCSSVLTSHSLMLIVLAYTPGVYLSGRQNSPQLTAPTCVQSPVSGCLHTRGPPLSPKPRVAHLSGSSLPVSRNPEIQQIIFKQAGTELGQAQLKLELYYTLISCKFGLIELIGWYIDYLDCIHNFASYTIKICLELAEIWPK